ncbi:MAG: mandelate racemase/muconate lactonizing enzyme family protein [Parvularculaceae bacterium]
MKRAEIDRRRLITGAAAAGVGLVGVGVCRAQETRAPAGSDLVIDEIKTYVMDDAIFVRVRANSGEIGWGECDAGSHQVMEAFIHSEHARRALGRDPFDTEPIWDEMFYRSHDFGPGGALSNSIAGIDIAIWDLKGRILDAPIHKLLGGEYRSSQPVYGSYGTGRWEKLTKKEAVAQAVKFVKRGFRTVKCRMQIREDHLNPTNDRTLEYVDAIEREIGSDAELFVDINNGYTAARAIEVGRVLQDKYGHRFYEEPCSDQNHVETAEVVRALDLGVLAGEKEYTIWQLDELIRYANPDYLNSDVIKAGGITIMDKIATLAQARQKPMILHNTRPTISTAASLQLVASMPTVGPFFEFPDVDRFPEQIGVVKNYLDYADGEIRVPQGPGLGMEIDEEKVVARASSVKASTLDD